MKKLDSNEIDFVQFNEILNKKHKEMEFLDVEQNMVTKTINLCETIEKHISLDKVKEIAKTIGKYTNNKVFYVDLKDNKTELTTK